MNKKPRIKIQHFGAIQQTNPDNDGWLDIDKVTVFIGDQGSGKSTVAKLISTFMWIEKALVRGDFQDADKNNFVKKYLAYHRLEDYIKPNSYIEYDGLAKHIIFENNQLKIQNNVSHGQHNYVLPQIMYVPAERNFISYVKNASELKIASDSMKEFITEFNNAKNNLKQAFDLPTHDVVLEYDHGKEILYLKGKDYKIQLSDGASGFQSVVPLLLVSTYLAVQIGQGNQSSSIMSEKERSHFSKQIQEILENPHLSSEQQRLAISILAKKFNKDAFINIVEEPEQNLFPTSQWSVLKQLLEMKGLNQNNQLIMTTHSPYIINYLSICIKAKQVYEQLQKIIPADKETLECLISKINEVVPALCWLPLTSDDLSIYQLKDGIVSLLPEIYGIPSDDNYLNQMLREGNDLVDKLFDIEDEFERRFNDDNIYDI